MRRLFLIAALAACACGGGDGEVSAEQAAAQRACAQIQERIESQLGKKFTGPIPVDLVDTEFIARFAADLERRMVPRGLVAAATRLAERLHQIPRGYDVSKAQIELVKRIVVGLYDPEKDRFYLVKGRASPGKPEFRETATHELVHAYRDLDKQYFQKILAAVAEDADRAVAISCLVEGDATFLGQGLGRAEGDPTPLLELIASRADVMAAVMLDPPEPAPDLKEFPFSLREMALGRYGAGLVFASKVYRAGGLDALSRAFDAPPRSTEQVLHPEKYIGPEVDEPTRFSGGDPTAALGPGWTRVMRNTMGEFEMRVLFGEQLGRKAAAAAAAGWDGALYHYCEKEGEPSFVGLATTWDSEQDAKEFARAWADWAGSRDGKEPRMRMAGKRAVVVTDEGPVVTHTVGKDVFVADGVPMDRIEAVLDALGSATRG